MVPALGPREVEGLRALWAEVGAEHSGTFAATSYRTVPEGLRLRISASVVQAVAPMAAALVSGYRVVSGGFMVKRPEGDVVKLHRHDAVLDEGRHPALLLWVPLRDTAPGSGCMVVVPGTHRSRTLTGTEIPPSEEPPEALEVPMRAGEALVMDHRLVHGSRPNRTGEERAAVSILLAPEGVPLWYCRRSPRLLEVFEVPDDFFLRWVGGAAPPLQAAPLYRFPLGR